jgi:hypothetical protein
MAEILKRAYNLVALKISLDLVGDDASVSCELQVTESHLPSTKDVWTISASEIGCPKILAKEQIRGHSTPFKKPDWLVDKLRSSIEGLHLFEGPLWLHFVKPYGLLGLAPWEKWFASLPVPVIRLPDVISDPPREAPATLDVLICTSSPVAKEEMSSENYVVRLVRQVMQKHPRSKVGFDVFTDLERFSQTQEMMKAEGLLGSVVRVHPPDQASSYAVPRRNPTIDDPFLDLESPWLLWMRNAIKGRSVDMVHFICHGYFNGDRGALAFAQSPTRNEDTRWSRFVGKRELSTFLTQVGAWAAAFSSPDENYSDAGLRLLADGLAQDQPCTVLYHDWLADPKGSQLGDAYQFLFQRQPGMPPRADALFLYCQPFRVKSGHDARPLSFSARTSRAMESPEVKKVLSASFEQEQTLPDWMAAATRYIERCEWNLDKSAQHGERLGVTRPDDEAAGVNQAIDQIKRAMSRIASRNPGTGSTGA